MPAVFSGNTRRHRLEELLHGLGHGILLVLACLRHYRMKLDYVIVPVNVSEPVTFEGPVEGEDSSSVPVRPRPGTDRCARHLPRPRCRPARGPGAVAVRRERPGERATGLGGEDVRSLDLVRTRLRVADRLVLRVNVPTVPAPKRPPVARKIASPPLLVANSLPWTVTAAQQARSDEEGRR